MDITPDTELATKNNSSTQLSLDTIIPKKYVIPNNKLANRLTKEDVDIDARDMKLPLVMNKKKEIVTKVYLLYDDENITIYGEGKNFTPYDRSVLNAVCSIFEAGNANFTASQVYRCMNGLNGTEKVSPQSVGAVTRSLDKMRGTFMIIDCSDEASAYKKSANFKPLLKDYILSAKKVTLTLGNNEVIGYTLNNKPILYEYAQFTNQVLSVPSKLLNTKDVLRCTPEVIIIRDYLIKRIEEMKNPKNSLSNKILFSTMFEVIGQPEPTKKKALKIRETVEKILGNYKKEKYIRNFKFSKKFKTFYHVEIVY